jgi:hypothetical protein
MAETQRNTVILGREVIWTEFKARQNSVHHHGNATAVQIPCTTF